MDIGIDTLFKKEGRRMSSIALYPIEKPESCGICQMAGLCKLWDFDEHWQRRHSDCPLIETPKWKEIISLCDEVKNLAIKQKQKGGGG
jgi:hypothetical protein